MGRQVRYNRVLAIFVVGFLCLNASGLLCISYCAGSVLAGARHFERAKKAAHCPHARVPVEDPGNEYATGISVRAASCSMMPVAMIAVPIEKRFFPTVVTVSALPAARTDLTTVLPPRKSGVPTFVYRPPPLDKRDAPSLTCVIRI